MGKHKGLLYEAVERLDQLMAIGESRRKAKTRARHDDPSLWSFSTGRMHSFQTRATYQGHVMRFLRWARRAYGVRRLQEVDAHAEHLTVQYLSEQMEAGRSAWTLQAQRSALRLFFGQRDLAAELVLPRRRREDIVRSRQPAVRDQDFLPEHWQSLISFLHATGLRRSEVRALRVSDVSFSERGAEVIVHRGKGGRSRVVPVLAGYEDQVRALVATRKTDERIFARLPSHLDIHALRRVYAQALYQQLSGRPLPPPTARLRPQDYDQEAVLRVSQALGHNRADVTLTFYLR